MKNNILPALLFTLCGLFTAAIQATPSISEPYIFLAQSNQSLSQATRKIKQKTAGRILSTKTVNKNGRLVYKIKVLLPSGKVQTFTVNAK